MNYKKCVDKMSLSTEFKLQSRLIDNFIAIPHLIHFISIAAMSFLVQVDWHFTILLLHPEEEKITRFFGHFRNEKLWSEKKMIKHSSPHICEGPKEGPIGTTKKGAKMGSIRNKIGKRKDQNGVFFGMCLSWKEIKRSRIFFGTPKFIAQLRLW